MSSLLDAVNVSTKASVNFDKLTTSKLPAKIGDVSFITMEQLYTALGGSLNSMGVPDDPSSGYNSSTFYVYAISNYVNMDNITSESTTEEEDITFESTLDVLQAIDINWYKEFNKPTIVADYWMIGDYRLFGGPLNFVYHNSDGTFGFYWHYSEDCSHDSNAASYWHSFVSGDVYVAVVRKENPDEFVIGKLPPRPGYVSIMTIKQAYEALGEATGFNSWKYDPTRGYDSSTYCAYGIVGDNGNNSTSADLQAVDISKYKQLIKPTTNGQTFFSNGKVLFGGPLDCIDRSKDDTYYFDWYYYLAKHEGSNGDYWGNNVSGSTCVAIVHTNTDVTKINNTIAVSTRLPYKSGDISIMTIEQAFVGLGGWIGSTHDVGPDPGDGYDSSKYYIYAVNDKAKINDALSNSTVSNLKAVGVHWYKQFNRPTKKDMHWTIGDHELFGGPLSYISQHIIGKYMFEWYCSKNLQSASLRPEYWCDIVPGSTYVAIVRR